ncbi:MAG: tetratricopeptide repeat protein [Candidatus Omnitrophica bacterium]|nr:tetratricopeptide repeat protein [Candidatus Omnitrophota bacterium]
MTLKVKKNIFPDFFRSLALVFFLSACANFLLPQAVFCQQNPAVDNDTAAGHYYRSKQLDARHRYDEAIGELEKALVMDPSFAKAHLMLGVEFTMKARYDEAIEEYNKAIALGLDSYNQAAARNNLGAVYLSKGMKDAAVQQFRLALKADPSFRDAQIALSRITGGNRVQFLPRKDNSAPRWKATFYYVVFYLVLFFLALLGQFRKKKPEEPKKYFPGSSTANERSSDSKGSKERGGCER